MQGKPTYAGSVKNQGSQVVSSIFPSEGKKGKSTVKTGNDLRTGGKN